ncbi:MAG: dihydroorotase [Lachnospiraceae bacterium]|nr:dihydroorotase [Lachnospiraceae bacterium]
MLRSILRRKNLSRIVILNGFLTDPKSSLQAKADLRISDGRIAKIVLKSDGGITPEDGEEVIDAEGLIVAPGLVDVHVHFRDPGFTAKEDIETGSASAIKGGYTSVVMMGNTDPRCDNPETLKYMQDKAEKMPLHIYVTCNATVGMKGRELADIETLHGIGAVGITDDGLPIMDHGILKQVFLKAASLGIPVSLHEEDPSLITNNGVNRGKASDYFEIAGSPSEAEYSLIRRDLRIASGTGVCVDIQHISTAEGVDAVRQAKANGVNVHAEATPHHFTLTDEAVITHGTLAKMNPPLRTEKDRLAIIEGLKDGTIDMIATDHAPHTNEEKALPITKAPSGIIGLETALGLGITELVEKGHLTMMELLKLMTIGPSEVYNLDAGYIAEGGPADIVLIDPNKEWTVTDDFASKAHNTPFIGWKLKGSAVMTIVSGNIVYRG